MDERCFSGVMAKHLVSVRLLFLIIGSGLRRMELAKELQSEDSPFSN